MNGIQLAGESEDAVTLTETCVFRNNDQILEDKLLTSVSTGFWLVFFETTELSPEKKKRGSVNV